MDDELHGEGEAVLTPGGLRMRVLKGRLEGDDAQVLGAAIDRLEAWDRGQEPRAWVTSLRPGIGLRAYPAGRRWSASTQASWGREP